MSIRVSWAIDFEIEDFKEEGDDFKSIAKKAAQEAMEIIMTGNSWAFDVKNNNTKECVMVDLTENEVKEYENDCEAE